MGTDHKEKLIRVLQILEETDEKSPMNARQILKYLEEEYQIEQVDRRSVYRDIKMLQFCGYEIYQCADKKMGWYMKKHIFSDWEIKIMLDAVQQARCISAKEAKELKERLLDLTSKRSRSRFCHMMTPKAGNMDSDRETGYYIETMLEAMYLHKKIEFQYTEVNEKLQKVLRREGKKYSLNLYEIYWSDNTYYLIGAHDHYDRLTSYRLDRIENLEISQSDAIDAVEKIGPNPELIIRKYIEESVNHFLGETVRIEVEYKPEPATNAILYDFVGKNVSVQKLENENCRAVFYKMNSVTLLGWFMKYMDKFMVIEPQMLRENIKTKLENTLEIMNNINGSQ